MTDDLKKRLEDYDRECIESASENKCCPRCGMDLKELIAKRDEHWIEKLKKED